MSRAVLRGTEILVKGIYHNVQRFKQILSGIDMTQGVPWKQLLLFTFPLLIGNLFQQLYSTADAIILGRYEGDQALASIGVSQPVFFLVQVLFMGVAMGAGVMVSQYFGARDRKAISYTIGTSITIIAIVSVGVMVITPFLTRPLLLLLATPAEILDGAVLYMNVLFMGVFGVAYFNILSGVLRGLGDAFSPLIYLIIACLLNILLDFFFIAIVGIGLMGVALATVIAQSLSAVLCFRRLIKMHDIFDINRHYLNPHKKYVNQILKLGIPSGVSQAIFAVAMLIVQPLVNGFGTLFIAANIIVMRIDGFIMMPNFSYGASITVYAGQNVGAGKMDRVDIGTRQCCIMAAATALAIVGLVLAFGRFIAGSFTETKEVIDMSVRLLRILAPGYIAFSFTAVLWGVIRGAGDAISPLWGSIINTAIIRVPSAFLLVHFLGRPESIMYSLLVTWVSGLVIVLVVYIMGKWRTKGLVGHKAEDVLEN